MQLPDLRPALSLGAFCALPLVLTASTVEERLQDLETKVTSLSQENAALKQQLGTNSFVTPQGKEKSLTLGGYVQFQGEFGDSSDSRFPAEDRFLIRRARLGIKASYIEDIDLVLQSEFGSGSLSPKTGYSAQVMDAYAVWKKYDFANVTVGQFKTPFGYEQLMSDTKLPFAERSLVSDKLTLSRQIGAMVSGDVIEKRLRYSAGLFNGTGSNTNVNDNDSMTYVGRVSGVVVDKSRFKLTAGANAFKGHDTGTAFTGDRTGYGLDVQASSGPFDFTAEWLSAKSDSDTAAPFTAEGWAVVAGYTIIPKKLQAVVRYETYDPKDTVKNDEIDIWTFGFNYFLKGDDLKLSLNYLLGEPAGGLPSQGRLLARIQVVF